MGGKNCTKPFIWYIPRLVCFVLMCRVFFEAEDAKHIIICYLVEIQTKHLQYLRQLISQNATIINFP